MEQLTEMDANFLAQESVATPMHISPVIIYDQSHRKGGKVRFKEILEVFRRNLLIVEWAKGCLVHVCFSRIC